MVIFRCFEDYVAMIPHQTQHRLVNIVI